MQATTYGIGFKAKADEVGGLEVVECLLAGKAHMSGF